MCPKPTQGYFSELTVQKCNCTTILELKSFGPYTIPTCGNSYIFTEIGWHWNQRKLPWVRKVLQLQGQKHRFCQGSQEGAWPTSPKSSTSGTGCSIWVESWFEHWTTNVCYFILYAFDSVRTIHPWIILSLGH